MRKTHPALRWMLAVLGTLAGVLVIVLMLAAMGQFAPEEPAVPPRRINGLSPAELLARQRAADRHALSSYGWVDRAAGVVRIPVDRAMDKLIAEGAAEND